MTRHLLTLLVFTPAIGALLVALVPNRSRALMSWLAVAVSLVPAFFAFELWNLFDRKYGDFQFVEHFGWLPGIGASYFVGIDGISLLLVALTVFLTPLVLVSAMDTVHTKVKGYLVAMLLLETTMLGTLVALDLLLFYVFWELMLVPMFLIIGVWGGERRMYASIKFLLFTMVGSLPMLAAILYLVFAHTQAAGVPSFALTDLYGTAMPTSAATLCFLAFFLAFAVKVPMFPLHTWLPDAHVEAPTGGSVILAGVLLKMGTYGFLRFVIPLFPNVMAASATWIAVLAVIGIVYGALVAMVQPDMKKLVAYSSVSHLGFVMLGIASLNTPGVEGAVYQMLNHGVSTGALFLLVGVVYERRHTRLISEYGGLWKPLPVYAVCFLLIMLSSIGLPGMNGFVGEFLILLGGFRFDHVLGAIAASGVVLGAAYMLWMYQRVMFGEVTNEKNLAMKDMSGRELAVIVPLIVLAFVMGVYPKPFFDTMHASVATAIHRIPPAAMAAAGHVGDARPAKVRLPGTPTSVTYEAPSGAGHAAGATE
ncbi:MAG TPA: NADH-quinone oxidoreductase subunit M [Candidatus Limnocylindrales bacterium]|nr:NADH-quinone oxidoreductase subunit M [Candidatus Limnocylindrales bacterium]